MKKIPSTRTHARSGLMKAVRVHQFGGLEAIVHEKVLRPVPKQGQVLVRVKAAGVGPWDAWVRAGKSALAYGKCKIFRRIRARNMTWCKT